VFRSTDGAWPVTVTPIAVNMVRQPLPAASRLRSLGAAIRAGVEAFPAITGCGELVMAEPGAVDGAGVPDDTGTPDHTGTT